ncbi:MAG TPA: glycosyltransferase family 39 protein [Saprospiraceae bacterium]|nr:glycosyltransferase family 39 protein [Saprospiraceae bacterium]HMQ83688.1 glycosyltransferase family 39 protein [Saprospiraceae bacterium]
MIPSGNKRPYLFLFAALGAVFFLPFLGGVHLFDWDEVNFAEISREMLLLKDYTRVHVNFEPFYQKPPFFFWLQVLAMKLVGIGDYAARLPNAICGIITLPLLYDMGRKLRGHRFGLLWAVAYFGSVLPFLYFKSGIIDPWFNLFIFLGLYFFILFYWKKEQFSGITLSKSRWYYLLLGGFFIGMGILTKGQVAYLIAVLTMGVYWIYQRFRLYVSIPQFLLFTLAASVVTLAWYGIETLHHGFTFVEEFNKYQYRLFSTPDAGHKGFPGYHFVVLLVGCFPASIFAIRTFFKTPDEDAAFKADFNRWMKILFWVVLILFTVVQSKIVHYSSMCYFPLTYLAALALDRWLEGGIVMNKWMKAGLLGVGGLYVLATALMPVLGSNAAALKPYFKDPFAQGNLEAPVQWSGAEVIPAVFLFILLWLFFRWANKGEKLRSIFLLFGGTAVFCMLALVFFIGRVEAYSQRAAVEFSMSKMEEDCYLSTYGYKSYIPLFYAQPQDGQKCCFKDSECTDRLIQGTIDKPAYIITKVQKAAELQSKGALREVGRKNGFVFFERIPEN